MMTTEEKQKKVDTTIALLIENFVLEVQIKQAKEKLKVMRETLKDNKERLDILTEELKNEDNNV